MLYQQLIYFRSVSDRCTVSPAPNKLVHVASHRNAPNCLTNIAALWPVLYVSRALFLVRTHCCWPLLHIAHTKLCYTPAQIVVHKSTTKCARASSCLWVCVCALCVAVFSRALFAGRVCVCLREHSTGLRSDRKTEHWVGEGVCVACVVVVVGWSLHKVGGTQARTTRKHKSSAWALSGYKLWQSHAFHMAKSLEQCSSYYFDFRTVARVLCWLRWKWTNPQCVCVCARQNKHHLSFATHAFIITWEMV